MIVGENARAEDLDVNPTKAKQQTNMRAASADVLVRLAPADPPHPGSLAGVPARGRVRRSHPRVGPPAQGRVLDKITRLKAAKRGDGG